LKFEDSKSVYAHKVMIPRDRLTLSYPQITHKSALLQWYDLFTKIFPHPQVSCDLYAFPDLHHTVHVL